MNLNPTDLHRLTAFVIDDEPGARQQLATDLRTLGEVGRVYAFPSVEAACLPFLEIQPDVVFLDMEMPGRSGLDFLDAMQPRVTFPFHVVFYSAFSSYMLDAIRRSAADFLLKPYKMDELRDTVRRVCSRRQESAAVEIPLAAEVPSRRKIAVQTTNELLLLTVEEVLLIRYDKEQRAWMLTLTDGSIHRLSQGTTAEDLLRLHRVLARVSANCVVNVAYLSRIENATLRCRLCPPFDGIEVYASRRFFSRLKETFELI